jgi:hypothetical protein
MSVALAMSLASGCVIGPKQDDPNNGGGADRTGTSDAAGADAPLPLYDAPAPGVDALFDAPSGVSDDGNVPPPPPPCGGDAGPRDGDDADVGAGANDAADAQDGGGSLPDASDASDATDARAVGCPETGDAGTSTTGD